MTQQEQVLWDKCEAFHGHHCGGSAIGFKAALYAAELLDLTFSKDEEVVCVTENDACGVDCIQVILGCSIGKGNLLFRMQGKQAFSIFNRKTEKSVRLVLRQLKDAPADKHERMQYLLDTPACDLFDVKEVHFTLPERARLFQSVICEECGEVTAEPYIHIENGRKLCSDCYHPYTRFM